MLKNPQVIIDLKSVELAGWKVGYSFTTDRDNRDIDIYRYSPGSECLQHRTMKELIYFNPNTSFENVLEGVPRTTQTENYTKAEWKRRNQWWNGYENSPTAANSMKKRSNTLNGKASGVRKVLIDSNGEFQGLLLPKDRQVDFQPIKDAISKLKDTEELKKIISLAENNEVNRQTADSRKKSSQYPTKGNKNKVSSVARLDERNGGAKPKRNRTKSGKIKKILKKKFSAKKRIAIKNDNETAIKRPTRKITQKFFDKNPTNVFNKNEFGKAIKNIPNGIRENRIKEK